MNVRYPMRERQIGTAVATYPQESGYGGDAGTDLTLPRGSRVPLPATAAPRHR